MCFDKIFGLNVHFIFGIYDRDKIVDNEMNILDLCGTWLKPDVFLE